MTSAILLTIGSVPISAWHLRYHNGDLLFVVTLYVVVVSAILAWLALPWIDWVPDPSAL